MEPIVFKPGQPNDQNNQDEKINVTVNSNPEPVNPSPSMATAAPSTTPTPTSPSTPVEPAAVTPVVGTVPVNEAAPPEVPITPAEQPSPAAGPDLPKAKKNKKNFLITVVLLVLAAVGGAFAYYRANNMAKPAVNAGPGQKEVAELRIGSHQFPFNAFYPDPNFTSGVAFGVNLQIYEGLVGFKNANSHTPLLAESWTNPDETTWVFKIKPNVKFHDGHVMTAEDVSHSIDAAVKDKNSLPLLVSTIKSVSVQDSEHVVIKTKGPDAILLNKLPFLYIQSKAKINGIAAGTGAYQLDPDFKPSEKSLHLIAFDNHHLGKPAVRKVNYIGFNSEAELLKAVNDGKVDLTDYLLKLDSQLADVPTYNKVTYSVGDVSYLGMNAEDANSPLHNLKVRQAIQLAIDTSQYIKDRQINAKIPSQMTVAAYVGFNPDLKPISRDITKAKALLKEAGYPNGLTLTLSRANERSEAGSSAAYNALKKQLADVGITLKDAVVGDSSAWFTKIDAGETQLFSYSVSSVFLDSYDIFSFNFRNKNFDSDTLNNLLDESNKAFDGSKHKQLLQQASKVIIDEAAAVPLTENLTIYYIKDNLNYKIDTAGYTVGGYIRAISAK